MGIYYDKRRGHWVARGSSENGKRKSLGSFETEKEALFAYDYYESQKAHLFDPVLTAPEFFEQTGDEPKFSQRMMKRLKFWDKDRFQKVRTDGSERV